MQDAPHDLWPRFVINLADNTTRLVRVEAEMAEAGLTFRRIEAVNGWAMTDAQIAEVYDRQANARIAKQDLVPAEIGCYLSHIHAWRAVAESGAAGGFVFEDDFAVRSGLADVLSALSIDAPNWDIVKLFTLRPDEPMRGAKRLTDGVEIGLPARVPSMMLGYAITRQAAEALLAQVPPFARPVDEDQKFFWEHGLRILRVQPPPLALGVEEAETGTIGTARRAEPKGSAWRKLRYQLGYQMRLRWYRARQ